MKVINNKEFDEYINSEKPTLVDFFATWCGPCKMLSPILEKVEQDSDCKYNVVKVDIDESLELARKFGIMSVPTMIIFKDGEVKDKIIGLRQKNQIEEVIKKYI